MIKQLTYQEIDFEKYRHCLNQSSQNTLCAQKDFLDFFSPNWELLVYNDYEYVMPVPLKKKLGFWFVAMPVFCQQLGVFGLDFSQDIFKLFSEKFSEKYKVYSYAFNSGNTFENQLSSKKNYIIKSQDYQELSKNFSKGRKAVINKLSDLYLEESELNEDLRTFILNNFKGLKNIQEVEDFLSFISQKNNNLKIFKVTKSEQLISSAIIYENKERNGLLALINDKNFGEYNGSTFFINEFLKSEIHKKDFDCMGGNLRGIEVFFKSFGATVEHYPTILNSKKDIIKKIFT